MLPPTLSHGALLLPLILSASATPLAASKSANSPPNCRFAHDYTQASILKNPEPFAQDLLYWEGKFHADNVGYNGNNGMTFDGTLLDQVTGLPTKKNAFSAASKEVQPFESLSTWPFADIKPTVSPIHALRARYLWFRGRGTLPVSRQAKRRT
jgi:hypothetical protein